VRTGFMLAQGGEFAFVLLSLAKELKVLPDELNRLLIIVVVLSMALTPLLADLGQALGEYYRRTDREVEGGEFCSLLLWVKW
jgi:Kef-type K+ transport system membrane component KefB